MNQQQTRKEVVLGFDLTELRRGFEARAQLRDRMSADSQSRHAPHATSKERETLNLKDLDNSDSRLSHKGRLLDIYA